MQKLTTNKDDKKKKRKIISGIIFLLLAAACITGIVIAYFSDSISKSGDLTSGTLDITGSYNFYVNGSQTPVDSVANLNPGDVVVVKATISNVGNKSAWVREVFSLDSVDPAIVPYISIYSGEYTTAELGPNGSDLSAYLLAITPGGNSVTANRVLNGTGDNAEVETGGSYNYVGSNTYDVSFSVYFSHTAPNEAQGKSLTLTVKTQALQFRNNDGAEPTETAWDAVVTTAFGL